MLHHIPLRFVRMPQARVLLIVTIACSVGLLRCATARAQATLTVLWNFTGGTDGANPECRLFQAPPGGSGCYLYGTARNGGTAGFGTVFQITPWGALTTLHEFTEDIGGAGPDGGNPRAGLTVAADGLLYGTTTVYVSPPATLSGEVFKTDPLSLSTANVYAFPGTFGTGWTPRSSVIQLGADNNLYGATVNSDPGNFGALFKMTPIGTISWWYLFTGGLDGAVPCLEGGLILGSDGALYGSANQGGLTGPAFPNGAGTLFKVAVDGTFTPLYAFTGGADGGNPSGYLCQATDGNFYGTCQNGGANGSGTLFRYSPGAGTVTTLHAFGSGADGTNPWGGVIQASDGLLYGTTAGNTTDVFFPPGPSTVFQANLTGSVFNTVYALASVEGQQVTDGVIQGADGRFYGTAAAGGANGAGTVFRLSLTTLPVITSLTPSSAAAGAAAFGLTVNGAGFDCGAVVYWNTTPLVTTVDSATQLGAEVPASLVATPGTATITVLQDGASTNALTFTITGAPVESSISPTFANAGGPGFTLTVKGSGFASGSAVDWNGSALSTTFVSSTKLTAAVPATLIASSGTATVTVVNPSPGGTSNGKTFTVRLTTLKLIGATLVANMDGSYTATVSIKNVGYMTAPSTAITNSHLGTAATTSALPVSLGSIPAGVTVMAMLNYPASAGSPGSTKTLKVSGTFTGGTFSASKSVVLP